MNYLSKRWKSMTLQGKLTSMFVFAAIVILAVNMVMYIVINEMTGRVENVYKSNVSLNDLSEDLETLQSNMEEYLQTRSSDAMEEYYRSEQEYRTSIEGLNTTVSDDESLLTEKNIHALSESYLTLTEGVIQAKRGRNVEKYSKLYENATTLYDKINSYIYSLNNQQFKGNSQTYQELIRSMRYMEVFNILILVLVMMGNICLIITSTRSVTEPLKRLSQAADEVAGGNFDLEEIPVENYDEVGNVTRAFNQMVESIRNYIEELRITMDRELQMQKHLKDAQLKYLQAQINPHFLYNTLNAGMQLAMMEGADQTEKLLGNLSDFFRYNVKREEGDATLEEEIRLVDNYVYILNVRFSGDIHFEKEIDESLIGIRVPSMILQPLVENAVNYGIRNVDWEGHIELSVFKEEDNLCISVWDNGAGMEKDRIRQVLEGKAGESDLRSSSNGVGVKNVMERLKLYFKDQAKLEIFSEGKDMGTEIMIRIPLNMQEVMACTE